LLQEVRVGKLPDVIRIGACNVLKVTQTSTIEPGIQENPANRRWSRSGSNQGAGGGTHAWASQPGALRVWNNQGNPASPHVYKLYSAARMKKDSMGFLTGEIPEGWRTQPDAFTDLNEPVNRGASWRYPILNPAALGCVEGFKTTQTDDAAFPWDTRTSMPVRWTYVSRDGTLSDTLQPTSVGRVAFWTDEETSKANINTASASADESPIRSTRSAPATLANRLGASFWTQPHTAFMQDYFADQIVSLRDVAVELRSHPLAAFGLHFFQSPAALDGGGKGIGCFRSLRMMSFAEQQLSLRDVAVELRSHPLAAFGLHFFQSPAALDGGGKGIRTPGLVIANDALYQLSYTPSQQSKLSPDIAGINQIIFILVLQGPTVANRMGTGRRSDWGYRPDFPASLPVLIQGPSDPLDSYPTIECQRLGSCRFEGPAFKPRPRRRSTQIF